MDTMGSAEFRKRYASLTEPTEVTVNGHVIGEWRPLTPIQRVIRAASLTAEEAAEAIARVIPQADPIERFNTQPFRGPIPKSGKPR